MGIPCTLTVSRTPSCSIKPITAATIRSQHIGLGTAEQQEHVALLVDQPVQPQMQIGVGLPLIGVEEHRRAA